MMTSSRSVVGCSIVAWMLMVSLCPADETITAKVVKIFDGDALLIEDKPGNQTEIKLEGIDAPELKQEHGPESAAALSKLVLDQSVKVQWSAKDKFERPLAQVFLDDKHINLEMLKLGMAWHFKRYNKSEELAAAEAQAKSEKKGLWKTEKAVPPWTFRQDTKSPDKPFRIPK
jgi:endonuclease YncB( thermonuclease family)